MSTIYDRDLDRNDANFVPLSPVSFVERSAEVFGDLSAVIDSVAQAISTNGIALLNSPITLTGPRRARSTPA